MQGEGGAHVAGKDAFDEIEELQGQRLVEAKLGIDARDVGVGGAITDIMALAGSPGSERTITNVTSRITTKVGTISTRRRRM